MRRTVQKTPPYGEAGFADQSPVPFKAAFFTSGGPAPGPESSTCKQDPTDNDDPFLLNIQEGSGLATHLGRFTARLTFCMDTSGFVDSRLEEGESIPYDRGRGVFVAGDGDSLFFSIEGEIYPSGAKGYDFQFKDTFVFTGGTGRFKEAAGWGTASGLVIREPDRTDHTWNAEIIMPYE